MSKPRQHRLVQLAAALAFALGATLAMPLVAQASEPAAPPALPRCATEGGDDEVIVLGKPEYRQQGTLGLNAVPARSSVGVIGLYRLKRTTRVSFLDLALEGYLVPGLAKNEKTWTYGRARIKRSSRWLSKTWLYDWSTYELKRASDEGLDLRAILASGFGAFLFHREAPTRLINLNLELGFVVDYANLRAYADQVFNGYAKSALELDFRVGEVSGKAVSSLLYQVTQAAPEQDTPDQTRHEVDLLVSYNLTRELRLTLGTAVTHYFLRPPGDGLAPRLAYTVFVGGSFRL